MPAVLVTLPLLHRPWHPPELQESRVWGRVTVDLSEAATLFDSLINVSLPVLMMPIFPNPLIELCQKNPKYSICWSTSGMILKFKCTLRELHWKPCLLQRHALSVCHKRKGGSVSQYSIIHRSPDPAYPVLRNITHIRTQINYKAFLRTIAATSSCFLNRKLRLFQTFPQTYSNELLSTAWQGGTQLCEMPGRAREHSTMLGI